jgi:hypothetical protein
MRLLIVNILKTTVCAVEVLLVLGYSALMQAFHLFASYKKYLKLDIMLVFSVHCTKVGIIVNTLETGGI